MFRAVPPLVAIAIVFGAAVSGAGAQRSGSQSPGATPDARVYRPGRDVTMPRVLRQVNPHYTPEAMREEINGTVLLECVVQTDGHVTDVRVVRSLDPDHGMNDEALRAAKQWLFAPGTKDGVPVPVLITIEMTFTMRSQPRPPHLPEGFGSASEYRSREWTERIAEDGTVTIRLSVPGTWSARPPLNPRLLLSAQSDAGLGTRIVRLERPVETKSTLDYVGYGSDLRRWTDELRQSLVTGFPGSQLVDTGQDRIGDRRWVWAEFASPSAGDAAALPPDAPAGVREDVERLAAAFDRAHIWVFVTVENHRSVTVACLALLRRDASDAERGAEVAAAAKQFASILSQVKVEPRP